MKRFIQFLFATAMTTVLFASCSKGTDPVAEPGVLELKADKTEVRADGKSTITFTAMYGEMDVTRDADLTIDGKAFTGTAFTPEEEGVFVFQAAYDGVTSNEVTITVLNADPITLTADKQIVEPGEEVTFTAMYRGEDVTDQISVCMTGDGSCLLSNVYTASTVGEYNFYAYFTDDVENPNHLVSNTVGVQVVADAENAVFEFHRNVAFFPFTATWCGPCSTLKIALHELEKNYDGNFTVVNFYSNDSDTRVSDATLFSDIVTQIVTDGRFGSLTGFPTTYIDFSNSMVGGPNYSQLLPVYNDYFDSDLKTTGIRVDSSISGETVTVNIEVRAEEADTYSIGALLVEDNIAATQNGLGNSYNHTNVLRAKATESIFGEELATMAAGDVATKTFTFPVVTGKYKPENLSVVVYTLYDEDLPTNNGGTVNGPVISNSVKATANGVTGYVFAE